MKRPSGASAQVILRPESRRSAAAFRPTSRGRTHESPSSAGRPSLGAAVVSLASAAPKRTSQPAELLRRPLQAIDTAHEVVLIDPPPESSRSRANEAQLLGVVAKP